MEHDNMSTTHAALNRTNRKKKKKILKFNENEEWVLFEKITTLHPREQNLKETRRLLQQISQVFVTPFPGLCCGLSFRKTIFALLIM